MKKVKWNSRNRLRCVLIVAFLGIAIVPACSARNTTTTSSATGPVISSQALQKHAGGGYCFVPEGEYPDICTEKGLMETANLFKYMPSSVTVLKQSLEPSSQGTGYEYYVEWTYSPSLELGQDEGSISGQIIEDPGANPAPVVSSWPAFVQNLRMRSSFPAGRPTSYRARNLLAGRRYVFYLAGTFIGGRERDRLVVTAHAIYLRIVVDLTRSSPTDRP